MMKRVLLLSTLCLAVLLLALALTNQPSQALPEYSAQTGEPCATCHVSPSGGGLRTPRGQAWVGSGKPGAVPDLNEALSVLGVNLQVDESQYAAPAGQEAPAAEPLRLKVKEGQAGKIHGWLAGYAGN